MYKTINHPYQQPMKKIVILLWLCLGVLVRCAPATPAALPTPTLASPSTTPAENTPTTEPTPTAENTPTLPAPVITELNATPTATATATPSPTPIPAGWQINGLAAADLVWLPAETQANIRQIYALGQSLGRYPNHFSKLGDSVIATPNFLTRFDEPGRYNLGDYAHLQPTIEFFSGSFLRYGVAIKSGLHSANIFDPFWADKEWCEPNEDILACEIRLHRPSIILFQMGSNDGNNRFYENMTQAVVFAAEQGVIPVLISKADRHEGDNSNNEDLYQIAQEQQIPLIDFDKLAETMPNKGTETKDNVHLTVFDPPNYTKPEAFTAGNTMHNLLVLFGLHLVWQTVQNGGN